MIYYWVFGLYISLLALALIAGTINKSLLHTADKFILFYFIATIISELISLYFTLQYKNNMYVYHVFSPIELSFIALYFQERNEWLRQRKIGVAIAVASMLFALCNAIFWQPINTINSIFLLFEGFIIIALCIFSYFQLVLHKEKIARNPHFWITTIFLIFWSVLFSYWGLYSFFLREGSQYMKKVTYVLWIINIASGVFFAMVFLNYRKMISESE